MNKVRPIHLLHVQKGLNIYMINKFRKDKNSSANDEFNRELSHQLKDIYEHTSVPQSVDADILKAKLNYSFSSQKEKHAHSFKKLMPVFAVLLLTISLIPVSLFAIGHTRTKSSDNMSAASPSMRTANADNGVFRASALTANDISSDMSIYDYLRKIILTDQINNANSDAEVHEPYTLDQPIKLENDFKSLENASKGSELLCEDENYFYYIQNNSQLTLTQQLIIIDKKTYEKVNCMELESGTYNEMYLYNSMLIIVADNNNDYISIKTSEDEYGQIFEDEESSVISVYDVSSVNSPKKVLTFAQQGELATTTMMDSKIITISKKKVVADLSNQNTPLSLYVPFICKNESSPSAVNDISVLDTSRKNTYYTISVIDTSDSNANISTKSFLGDVKNYFISESGIFISYTNTDYKTVVERIPLSEPKDTDSVHAENKNKNTVIFEENFDNELFFNENDGNIFVTSSRQASYGYEGIMYVLNSDNISEYTKFKAHTGSEIACVSYFDDTIYWVPQNGFASIMVLDISDIQNISVVNKVSLSSSIEYIYKLSDNYILGVGYSNQSGSENKITLSLFNVENKYEPYFINGVSLGNNQSLSDIYYDFRALKSYDYNGITIIGCPVNLFTASETDLLIEDNLDFCGIYLFVAKQSGLRNIIALAHTDEQDVYHQINRWSIVGDKVFAFSDYKMTVNSVENGRKISETFF